MDCQEARPNSKLTTCSFLLLVLSSLLCSIFLTVDKKKVRFEGAAEICADVPLLLSDFCSFSLLSGLRVEFVVWSLQASHSWEHSSTTYLHFESNCPFAPRWTLIKKHLTFFFSSHLCASLQCTMLLLSCESKLLWSRKGSHMSVLKKSNQTSPLQATLPVGSPDLLERLIPSSFWRAHEHF